MPSGPRRSSWRRHPRAIAVAASGVVALIAAGGFGTPSLRPLGVGLILLGAGAIALVEIAAKGIRITRSVSADTVRSGEPAVATIRLRGWPVRHRLLGMLDWEIRPSLPAAARAEPRRPSWIRGEIRGEFRVAALPRGEHRFGPPGVAIADPFGLARVRRAATATDTILVLPRTVPIVIPFWESGAARRAGRHAGQLRGRAELGGIRDYEPGDPLSLIHWAQTARRGRLQTKELHGESGRGASVLVVLDARADPGGGGPPDGPFEVAVSAAASLIAACAARGDAVGLEHTASRPAALAIGTPAGTIERELAMVRSDGSQAISLALRGAVGRSPTARTVVLVSASGDRGLAAAAGQARAAGVNLAAVLVGPARAYGQEIRRTGAWVAEIAGTADLAAALDGSVGRAQRI